MKLSRIAKRRAEEREFSFRNPGIYKGSWSLEIKNSDGTFRHDNMTNKKCPRCGKRLLGRQWKKQ